MQLPAQTAFQVRLDTTIDLPAQGGRAYPTTGQGGFLHPRQEAEEAENRLLQQAKPAYGEFLVLRFRATNQPPYPFEWVDYEGTKLDYAAVLARISAEYQRRF